MRFTALVLAALLLLAGCAVSTVKTAGPETPIPTEQHDAGAFGLAGRVAVKYDDKGFSGSLRWQYREERDEVVLWAPLGQTVAVIERNAQEVTLTTSDQKVYRAEDAESLTLQTLGWQLPLKGLRYWVKGVNSPHTSSVVDVDGEGRVARVLQDGWEIQYSSYFSPEEGKLPRRMVLRRENLEIRLIIDRWEPVKSE